MGEQWEWTQTRRALSFVVSAVLEKMRLDMLRQKMDGFANDNLCIIKQNLQIFCFST